MLRSFAVCSKQLKWSLRQQSAVLPWQSSLCGAVAGGVSAALTTPLDVAKTRIMLAPVGSAAVIIVVIVVVIIIVIIRCICSAPITC